MGFVGCTLSYLAGPPCRVAPLGKIREAEKRLPSYGGSSLVSAPTASDGQVRMISCGADKSIYFRTAQKVRALGVPQQGRAGTGFRLQEVKGEVSPVTW